MSWSADEGFGVHSDDAEVALEDLIVPVVLFVLGVWVLSRGLFALAGPAHRSRAACGVAGVLTVVVLLVLFVGVTLAWMLLWSSALTAAVAAAWQASNARQNPETGWERR